MIGIPVETTTYQLQVLRTDDVWVDASVPDTTADEAFEWYDDVIKNPAAKGRYRVIKRITVVTEFVLNRVGG